MNIKWECYVLQLELLEAPHLFNLQESLPNTMVFKKEYQGPL